MKLTATERNAILRGEFPPIVRTEEVFKKGETIALKSIASLAGPVPLVSITVLKLKKGKKGEQIPEYSVRDDRGLYLAHNGGYTRSASASLDWEASVDDPSTLQSYVLEGSQKTALQGAEGRQREKASEGQRKLQRAKERGSKGEQRYYERVQRHKEARKAA